MKKSMRSIVIMLIAVMTLSLFTMFPIAAGTTITQVNIKKTDMREEISPLIKRYHLEKKYRVVDSAAFYMLFTDKKGDLHIL